MGRIQKTYGETTNSDLTDQKIIVQRIPQYTAVTLNSGGKITCSAWDGTKGGIVVLSCNGTIAINSGGSIDVSELGYRGGLAQNVSAYQGEGSKGAGAQSLSANGNGGGGAGNGGGANIASGGAGGHGIVGGNGGKQNQAIAGIGGEAIGSTDLVKMFFGGASGGCNSDIQGPPPSGSNGGGLIYLIADTVAGSGSFYSKGQRGYNHAELGGNQQCSSGAAGGSILIKRNVYSFSGSLSVAGGVKGVKSSGNYESGAGSVGRSKVDGGLPSIGYGNGKDGSVTLSSSATIDSSLKSGGRTYADGINYGVSALTDYTIVTSTTPNGITNGDLLLLMNMRGGSSKYANVGNYEIVSVIGVNLGTNTINSAELIGGGMMLLWSKNK